MRSSGEVWRRVAYCAGDDDNCIVLLTNQEDEMAKLTDIEGIGPVLGAKFAEVGVRSVEALLKRGKDPSGRAQLSQQLSMDSGRLLRFVNAADLMRLRGVGGEYAELLEAAGVDTVWELRGRNASNLAATLRKVNEEKSLVRVVPGEGKVADWVAQAKTMERGVHY